MKYEYSVRYDTTLRHNPTSPVPSADDVEDWLNRMDELGWEYVGSGQKFWHDRIAQTFWVFRRPRKLTPRAADECQTCGSKCVSSALYCHVCGTRR
jgi:hypothetical protein